MDSQNPAPHNPRKGQAIAGMVLGIVALVVCYVPYLGAALAVLAVVFSGTALNGADDAGTDAGRGMAVAGLVTGIVALVVGIPVSCGTVCLCANLPAVVAL